MTIRKRSATSRAFEAVCCDYRRVQKATDDVWSAAHKAPAFATATAEDGTGGRKPRLVGRHAFAIAAAGAAMQIETELRVQADQLRVQLLKEEAEDTVARLTPALARTKAKIDAFAIRPNASEGCDKEARQAKSEARRMRRLLVDAEGAVPGTPWQPKLGEGAKILIEQHVAAFVRHAVGHARVVRIAAGKRRVDERAMRIGLEMARRELAPTSGDIVALDVARVVSVRPGSNAEVAVEAATDAPSPEDGGAPPQSDAESA
jgi:hypothetical protein